MTQQLVERTTEISSQNRVYTEQQDREAIPVDQNQSVFVVITKPEAGIKEFGEFVVKFHSDGEFFIPSEYMNQLDLSVGDEVTYRIF